MEALSNSLDMPAFKITNQPKTSENKTQTQNSAHEQLGESQNVVVLLHNIGVPFQNNEDRYTWFVQWLLKNVQ